MTPDAFFPIGLKIYHDIEELSIEKVLPEKLEEVEPLIGVEIPPLSRETLQNLSFFYEEFYRWVLASGYSTRSLRYRTVSEAMDEAVLDPYRQVFLSGFFALTRSEKDLFKKISSLEKVGFLFKEGTGLDERLADLGMRAERNGRGETDPPEVHFYQSPDTHGQVFALSGLLEEKGEGRRPSTEKTVIVLPSPDTLFPLFHHTLSLIQDENWNISMGYPLHRTPVYGFFNSLMELVASMDGDRVYVPDYLKFVLHPYTKNIYFKDSSEVTRILFHSLEEHLTDSRGQRFLALSEIEENRPLFEEIAEKVSKEGIPIPEEDLRGHLKEIHRNTIHRFLSFQHVRDFALKSIDVLDFLFRRSTARLHPFFHPFTEAFLQSLDTLARSLMGEIVFEKTASYFTLCRRYLLTCTTPFEGTPVRGLQVLGVLETRTLSFDRVFILDVNEEILPDTRKEDSLLPFQVRKGLGLPTYLDRDQLAAYHFETLWKGAREVHLFFIENDQKEKSRFVESLLWEKQRHDRTLDAGRYLSKVQYRVDLKNRVPGEIQKSEGIVDFLREYPFSATTLDAYLGCPRKFYYASVLGLGKKDEISGEVERADIGKFVHEVLSQYFGRRKGFRLKPSDIDLEEMDRFVEALFEKDYGREPLGATYLLKRQIKAHLRDFLMHYTIPLLMEKAVTVLEVEHPVQRRVEGFRIKGRLDHIERRGGTVCIVDYKTSSNPEGYRIRFDKLDLKRRETWGGAIGSLQLPFYLLLYSEAHGKGIEELEAMFLLLGKAVINREIELPLFHSPDGRRERLNDLKTVILTLLREIIDPNLPFYPTSDPQNLCPICDFQCLCGTQWLTK